MPELDELLRATLDRHAAGEIDRVTLVARATDRGRAVRRRRRTVLTLTAAAVAVLVAAGGTVVVRAVGDGSALRPGAVAPAEVTLPDAGLPGAAIDPAAVGTDPNFVHFAAPAVVAGARHHTWSSTVGYERLEAEIDGGLVYVTIGRDQAAVDQADAMTNLPAVLRREPVPGLWLRVDARDDAYARRVAATLDLERTQRILLPFQLVERPSEIESAYVGFIGDRYAQGGVVLRDTQGGRMEVQAQYARDADGTHERSNYSARGRPAYVYPGQDEVALLGVPHLEVTVRIGKAYEGFGVADADAVLATLNVTDRVERIDTWPSSLTLG
ncbi:hypothetical protein [Asanoa siamensis]|uniref:Sigma E regulatory protein, MucB/RseB n=1 Tax=Asanoa siamensis TaxID=926357 RepID=A0ABQ4D1F5_9ACTN|nr:hypothetical protein [Asanoa siamensis]GIF76942.1 hypothetical protein Asi02nite_64600 [Asanoa siamensis]